MDGRHALSKHLFMAAWASGVATVHAAAGATSAMALKDARRGRGLKLRLVQEFTNYIYTYVYTHIVIYI